MRVKSILLASTGALALLCAAPAHADGFYVGISGAATFMQDESGTFFSGKNNLIDLAGGNAHADFDIENGFMLSGAIGFGLDHWLHGLNLEGEVGYRRNNVGGHWESSGEVIIIGPGSVGAAALSSGEIEGNLSTFSIMANLWYEFDVGMRFKPYIGGGVGWARTQLDGVFAESRRASLTAAAVDPFDGFQIENSGFAYQLGFGISSQIAPGARLGLGYRYFDGPNVNLDVNNSLTLAESGPGHFKFDDNSHNVAVTLGIDIN